MSPLCKSKQTVTKYGYYTNEKKVHGLLKAVNLLNLFIFSVAFKELHTAYSSSDIIVRCLPAYLPFSSFSTVTSAFLSPASFEYLTVNSN